MINIRDHQEAKISDLSTRVRDLENENDTLMQSERRANFKIELLQEGLSNFLKLSCNLIDLSDNSTCNVKNIGSQFWQLTLELGHA